MLHVALLTEVVSNTVSDRDPIFEVRMNHSSSSTNASLYNLHGKFMLGISSQDSGGLTTSLARGRLVWVFSFFALFFFCSHAHIADLQTCVKFTHAVNVTYCKGWKCGPCHSQSPS